MKIDRNKLNTLLRSGLNPEIKTRKQLAAYLGLDATSLTRWFATRDRLGNPRYPVVPDRHVTKILALFNLTAQCFSLNDEEFRQHCFELSLLRTKIASDNQADLAKKSLLRLEQAAKRKLTLQDYSVVKTNKMPLVVAALCVAVGGGWFLIGENIPNFWLSSTTTNSHFKETKCWTGYSSVLGDFKQQDSADPCHYGKLFHNALKQLKIENKNPQISTTRGEFTATEDYILFLSKQLDQRRINERIAINIELGKNEMQRLNYQAAQNYFKAANEILLSSPNSTPRIATEISTYLAKINALLN